MTPSRNRPCPCGSGRKYKNCCALPTPASEAKTTRVIESFRRRLDVPALIVCLATRGSVSVETFSSAVQGGFGGFPIILLVAARKPVEIARNSLAAMALAVAQRPEVLPWDVPELFVFWIDDDAYWAGKQVRRAVSYLQENPEISVLSGNFSRRVEFGETLARPKAALSDDLPKNEPGAFEISSSGFHWLLMRTSVLASVGENPFSPIDDLPEDASFFKRAEAAGVRSYCAGEIVIPHIEVETGKAYLPGREAWQSSGSAIAAPQQQGPILHKYGGAVDDAYIRHLASLKDRTA